MADLSAFSNPSFNEVNWIDLVIHEKPDDEQLDSYITSLAMKLHVLSQDYSDQLEEGMVEAANSMPRILSDISRIQDTLKHQHLEIAMLAGELREFDQRNINKVEDLSRLDTLKLNMEKCKATLEEHARWSQLVREAKNIMESGGKFSESADRIEILSRSLQILQCMPGHEEREQTYNSLTDTLIAGVQPRIMSDIMGREMSSLREFLYVYIKLNRYDEFVRIFVTSRPQKLQTYFDNCYLSLTSTQSPPLSNGADMNVLVDIYGKIYGFLLEESEYIAELFGSRLFSQTASQFNHGLNSSWINILMQVAVFVLHQYYHTGECSQESSESSKSKSVDAKSSKSNETKEPDQKGILNLYNNPKYYLLIEEFSKKFLQLIASKTPPEIDQDSEFHKILNDTIFQIYYPLIVNKDTLVAHEARYLKKHLLKSLSNVAFKKVSTSKPSGWKHNQEELNSDNFLDDDNLLSLDGSVASNFLTDGHMDASGVFEQYGRQFVKSIEDMFTLFGDIIPSSIRYMGGMYSKTFLRVLSPILSQHIKSLIYKVDELRVAACLPVGNNQLSMDSNIGAVSITASVGSGGDSLEFAEATAIAKHFNIADMGSTKGVSLLASSLSILQGTGSLVKQLKALERNANDLLENVFVDLFSNNTESALLVTMRHLNSSVSSTTSIGCILASHLLKQERDAELELRAFLAAFTRQSSASVPQTVFGSVIPAVSKLRLSAEKYFFQLATLATQSYMHNIHQTSSWTSSSDNTDLYDGSILPQQAIRQIGEYLLSLLQELESYASGHEISDLLQLRGDADSLSVAAWAPLKQLLKFKDDEGHISLAKRDICQSIIAKSEMAMFGIGTRVATDVDLDSTSQIAAEDETLAFVNEWLGAVADHTVGSLVSSICQIACITVAGRKQLKVDLEYLSNVIGALGLKSHPVLPHLLLLTNQEEDVEKLATLIDFIPVQTTPGFALHKLDTALYKIIYKH